MPEGRVFVDSARLVLLAEEPVQAALEVSGNLPTPCHKLQWDISGPGVGNRVDVRLYSLVEAGSNCIQVLKPFSECIPLGVTADGEYDVYINGEQVGTINDR